VNLDDPRKVLMDDPDGEGESLFRVDGFVGPEVNLTGDLDLTIV
jgi:hypothetical protein